MWRGLCLAALVLVTGCGGGAETGGGGVEAASPAGAAAPAAGAAIDITAVKPFVLEKDASFQALIDAAPVWAQVEARGDAAARKGALGEVILQVLKRDGVSKFPKAPPRTVTDKPSPALTPTSTALAPARRACSTVLCAISSRMAGRL